MEIRIRNVNDAFTKIVNGIHTGKIPTNKQDSRNGGVLRIDGPLLITYSHPTERVLFNQSRDANPFMHLYEALWMLAGRNDLAPLAYYNPKMAEFSDNGTSLNGAYGRRWRFAKTEKMVHGSQFEHYTQTEDQLKIIIDHLKRNPQSRRAVLAMWNVEDDLLKIDTSKDVCCNLDVIFDIRVEHLGVNDRPIQRRYLDMTVINRSNDLIWGTLGANAVHFSVLQEYVAACLGVAVGVYHQFSTNAHVYEWNWKPEEWLADRAYPLPEGPYYKVFPLVKDPATFDKECARFVDQGWGENSISPNWNEPFIQNVAFPMRLAFHNHKRRNYEKASDCVERIEADDWRIAARNWIEKRKANWESKSAADRRSTLQDAD